MPQNYLALQDYVNSSASNFLLGKLAMPSFFFFRAYFFKGAFFCHRFQPFSVVRVLFLIYLLMFIFFCALYLPPIGVHLFYLCFKCFLEDTMYLSKKLPYLYRPFRNLEIALLSGWVGGVVIFFILLG